MRLVRLGVPILLAVVLTGCGPISELASLLPIGSGAVDQSTSTPAPPEVTLPPIAQEFKTCELVPLAEVQARSPLRTPLVVIEPENGIESRCRYNSSIDPPVDWPNSFLLSMTDLLTPEEADVAMDSFRDFADTMGYAVETISGVGDETLAYKETDYSTYVQAKMGQYVVHVLVADSGNLEFPEVPHAQKAAAGADVLRYALAQINK